MKLNKIFTSLKSLIILLIPLFLLGCSETTFLVNSAKRIGTWGDEPIYKIGTPYKINGKWYYPAVDYDYEEIGIASWYGPGFHGKKTANGEIFDQNKISAAHRTLPMPSIVRVTNLDDTNSVNLSLQVSTDEDGAADSSASILVLFPKPNLFRKGSNLFIVRS